MSLDGNIRIGPKIAVQIHVTNVKTEDQNVEKASFVKEVHQRQKCTFNGIKNIICTIHLLTYLMFFFVT